MRKDGSVTWESTTKEIVKTVLGLVIAAAAGYLGWVVLHNKPIDRPLVYFSGGGVFLGALLVAPEVVYDAAKKLVSLLPSVKIGGGTTP